MTEQTEYVREIARVESTHLGYESHGIMTALLQVNYGGLVENIGGYYLGETNGAACTRFIQGILSACGVDAWEKVRGRTIFVLSKDRRIVGIEPLPTEPGKRFVFADASEGEAKA